MNKIFFVGISLLMLATGKLCAQNGDAIVGRWMDEAEKTIVEITKDTEQNVYNGTIVWLRDSLDAFGQELRDVRNNNVELRSRKVVGTKMLESFVWDGTDSWKKGRIYYYHSGSGYNGKIHINEAGHLRLKGYFSILFFLGKTQTWKRVPYTEIDSQE